MSTLPERLQDVIVSFRRLAKDHEIKADRPHQDDSTRQWHMGTAEAYDDAADRLEAAQSLQAPEGWVLVPREPTEEMIEAAATAPLQSMQKQRQRLRLGEILRIEYAAMLSAAPSPTAALQAGVGRFVACRCVSERDRELCMTKDECSKVYAYSDTATKEPTK